MPKLVAIPPPRRDVPPSGDARWRRWGDMLLAWILHHPRKPISKLHANLLPGWTRGFLTNVIIWLELRGELGYANGRWGRICEREGCDRIITRQRYCSKECMLAQRSYRDAIKQPSERRTELCSRAGCRDPVPKGRLRYCSTRCGYKDRQRKNRDRVRQERTLLVALPKVCGTCGKKFTPPAHLYGRMTSCSTKCRDKKWHNDRYVRAKRILLPKIACKHCGEKFNPKVKLQLYCDKSCYRAAAYVRRTA